ncbi:MAG: hypothetical protein MUP74_01380, partial [Desulfobacterales bacterium]|nr:hypothetical protein [Desulfobacterales bacterium]
MKGRAAKGLVGVLAGMFLALVLIGCGSDSSGTTAIETPEGTPETPETITIEIQLSSQNTGQPTNTVSVNSPGTLRIAVTSDTRGPLTNRLITATTTKGLLSPADGTALTDAGGIATIGLLAGTDSGAGLVTATLEEASADLAFQIAAAPDAQSAAIEFVSATPQTIALKGTGGAGRSEASTVVFRVVDEFGSPVRDKTVTFELSSSVGGLALNNTSALSNSDGLASVVVTSGNVATTVRV